MKESNPIRVMIVDDNDTVLGHLATILRVMDDLKLVGQAATGEEAVRLCGRIKPEVILMDIMGPANSRTEPIRKIKERWPNVHVIAMTSLRDPELVREATQAGAECCLEKNVSVEGLAEAFRAARTRRSNLALYAEFPGSYMPVGPPPLGWNPTGREREVLSLMVEGLSNSDIADHLAVSPSTVKAHVRCILTKLGTSRRARAIALARQHKLVT